MGVAGRDGTVFANDARLLTVKKRVKRCKLRDAGHGVPESEGRGRWAKRCQQNVTELSFSSALRNEGHSMTPAGSSNVCFLEHEINSGNQLTGPIEIGGAWNRLFEGVGVLCFPLDIWAEENIDTGHERTPCVMP